MNKLWGFALVVLLLVSCGALESKKDTRAFETAEVQLRWAEIYTLFGQRIRDVHVGVRVQNPSDSGKDMPLSPGAWNYKTVAGQFIRAGGLFALSESTCSRSAVPPGEGGTCSLWFNFGEGYYRSELVPGRVSFAPTGWSGGADVTDLE